MGRSRCVSEVYGDQYAGTTTGIIMMPASSVDSWVSLHMVRHCVTLIDDFHVLFCQVQLLLLETLVIMIQMIRHFMKGSIAVEMKDIYLIALWISWRLFANTSGTMLTLFVLVCQPCSIVVYSMNSQTAKNWFE